MTYLESNFKIEISIEIQLQIAKIKNIVDPVVVTFVKSKCIWLFYDIWEDSLYTIKQIISIHFLLTTRRSLCREEGGGYCGSSYSIDMRMS